MFFFSFPFCVCLCVCVCVCTHTHIYVCVFKKQHRLKHLEFLQIAEVEIQNFFFHVLITYSKLKDIKCSENHSVS